jgi:hypothetical protein
MAAAMGVPDGREDDVVLPTKGACMRPWIWPGGQLQVRRCRVEDLRVGDIAVWFDGRKLLSHRVLDAGTGRFVTSGDWSPTTDPAAGNAELLGRAVRFTLSPHISWPLDGWVPQAAGRVLAALPRVLPIVAGVVRAGKRARRAPRR